jgi:hypothetical protein
MPTNVQTIVDLCKGVEVLLEENERFRLMIEELNQEIEDLYELVKYYETKPLDNKRKLTAGDVIGIHQLKKLDVPIAEIAKIYGVNKSTISRTLKGIYNK